MKTVTLSAHFDGGEIKLDEPYEIPADARLLVTVLPGPAEDAEWAKWAARSARSRWFEDNPY